MMNTKTMRKAARDLVPGDILPDQTGTNGPMVVLNTGKAAGEMIRIDLAHLGSGSGVSNVRVDWHGDAPIAVECAGLTPVQAAADKLLGLLREAYATLSLWQDVAPAVSLRADISALLDELDPPKPPTLEEAVALLRQFADLPTVAPAKSGSLVDDTRKFLMRVPD